MLKPPWPAKEKRMESKTYGLDLHCQTILEDYRATQPMYSRMKEFLLKTIRNVLSEAGILVTAVEGRVKTEESLVGKLELKGSKYSCLEDITDILGLRVITFYTDDVDKVASVMERLFEIDWENSIDQRKLHKLNSFGYNSLHYICRLPKEMYTEADCPAVNRVRFEIQMRTTLQHAWANMYHDTGYKSGVEIPDNYLRNLNRLAGMLELADEQFSQIRSEINDYRRKVRDLVVSGNLEDVALDGDTFRSFLSLKPFDALNRRIAAVNQAEIQEVSLMSYLSVFKALEFATLGDIQEMIRNCSEGAYQLACYQISLTDLDILSSSVAPQNLCIVHILKKGAGAVGIRFFLDLLNGPSESNQTLAEMFAAQAEDLPFMHSVTNEQ